MREDDRGNSLAEEPERQACRLGEIRRPDAELAIDDGRVVAKKQLVARGGAALRDLLDCCADDVLCVVARVRDRRGGHDELRLRAVVTTDPPEAPEQIGDVAPENAAIRVQLVDHDVTQVLEQRRPLRVVGQDPGMEHVRVRQDEVRAGADGATRVLRRIAVVGEHPELRQLLGELLELGELVLRERLRGKQIQNASVRLVQQRLQDRQVVAERLAGRGRCHDDNVVALLDERPRARLMRVQLGDSPRAQGFSDAGIE